MALTPNEKIGIMNQYLFNKKETIIIAPNTAEEIISGRVEKQVLAGMIANMEELGYQFSHNDIFKMAEMSEETLTTQVYTPLLQAMKEAKGVDVEHHILFPDFPASVKNLDIDTLSDYRFMSYFTTLYDEYIDEISPFEENSLTTSLKDELKRLSDQVKKESQSPKERTDVIPDTGLITVHLGTIDDYYKMVQASLEGKTSLSDYDKEIVLWSLDNLNRKQCVPNEIPFKENWALLALHDFKNQQINQIDIKTYKDYERLLAALTKDYTPENTEKIVNTKKQWGDISLSQKQHYRNFSNQERKILKEIFIRAIRNNKATMLESALTPRAKRFAQNVLIKRLHFNEGRNSKEFMAFMDRTKELRTKMSIYETNLQNQNYYAAAKTLQEISSGQLLRNAKHLVAKEGELRGDIAAIKLIQIIEQDCRTAPMDILLSLRKEVESNISAKDSPIKFYFKRSSSVIVEPFENKAVKLSETTREYFLQAIDGILQDQLKTLGSIGKVYIDENLKQCPIPVVGRSDSGKNRTVATGTQLPMKEDTEVLRAALYKKGPKDGFFDFSCAFLDENYKMVGQVSWNNLKEGAFSYHSGDCLATSKGVTEVIDVNLKKIKEEMPQAKYVVYEGMAWGGFTTVNELENCFMTLASAKEVGEDIRQIDFKEEHQVFEPKNTMFKVDLTGNTHANIPMLYDIENHKVTMLNMATKQSLPIFGQPNNNRHFDLPDNCVAIENYAGELAMTAYYINERIMQDKPSLYALALLNVEARNGILVDSKEEADVIFSIDRETTEKEEQKVVSVFDKDVINTEFMVPKMDEQKEQREIEERMLDSMQTYFDER